MPIYCQLVIKQPITDGEQRVALVHVRIRARIHLVTDHAIRFRLCSVVFVVPITRAKITPHVGLCMLQNVTGQVPRPIVGLEALEVVVRDEPLSKVQEIVTRLVQSIDISACLEHVVDDQGLLALSQCFHNFPFFTAYSVLYTRNDLLSNQEHRSRCL
jgi:hypothetical protein